MIEQNYALFISSVSVGVIVFTLNLLALRLKQQQAYLPLILFYSGLGIIFSKQLTASLVPELQLTMLVFSLPAILILAPSFWCYVEGLTHTKKWQFERRHIKHFALSIIGLLISISTLLLPTKLVQAVFANGEQALTSVSTELGYFVSGLLILTFILVLAFVLQSGLYIYAIFKRLITYRKQLKQVFASTESKEFYWITGLIIAVGMTWFLLAMYLVFDNLFSFLAFSFEPFKIVVLAMIWSIAIWALRHKPGFEEIYGEETGSSIFDIANDKQIKYQKSALSDEQATYIAKSVNEYMQEYKPYLEPNISLQKLAKNVNTTPNYLSQTLNEKLDMNFFDYVNKHRIENAVELLRNSNTSVLDIAMESGFNSKSSFYVAFKKVTGMTPSEFRKQHK